MYLVLGVLAAAFLAYLAFEWIRAGRMKKRLAAGGQYRPDVNVQPLDQTLADKQHSEAANVIDQTVINGSGMGFKNSGGIFPL